MTENKGDLISREALKETFKIEELYWGKRVIETIDNAPTAIIDRPQGEWKHIGGDEWVCSECGHVITTEGSWEKPLSTGAYHCENCGADMKGGAK